MKKYLDLIMGLVSGLTLILLNTQFVQETIMNVTTFFDPTNIHTISFKIGVLFSRGIMILSFIGIFIVITCVILILKKVLTDR